MLFEKTSSISQWSSRPASKDDLVMLAHMGMKAFPHSPLSLEGRLLLYMVWFAANPRSFTILEYSGMPVGYISALALNSYIGELHLCGDISQFRIPAEYIKKNSGFVYVQAIVADKEVSIDKGIFLRRALHEVIDALVDLEEDTVIVYFESYAKTTTKLAKAFNFVPIGLSRDNMPMFARCFESWPSVLKGKTPLDRIMNRRAKQKAAEIKSLSMGGRIYRALDSFLLKATQLQGKIGAASAITLILSLVSFAISLVYPGAHGSISAIYPLVLSSIALLRWALKPKFGPHGQDNLIIADEGLLDEHSQETKETSKLSV